MQVERRINYHIIFQVHTLNLLQKKRELNYLCIASLFEGRIECQVELIKLKKRRAESLKTIGEFVVANHCN